MYIFILNMILLIKRYLLLILLLLFLYILKNRYEVITTATDIIMVIEYAGKELFNYIVDIGKVIIDYKIDR